MNHNPKIFIHYSWDNELHKTWTLYLANRLTSDGVDVIFDQYDLKLGSNNNYFMEQISKGSKVLLIMTPDYKIKADNRTSGVGYEYQIISTEFAKTISTNTKFLPILRAGDIESSIPTFLQSFLYLDVRDDGEFERKYIELLKNIYDEPLNPKPPLGKKPNFTDAKSISKIKTITDVLGLGLSRTQVHKILGKPDTKDVLIETYWSHGLEVIYNKHWDKVDGVLAKRQPSGISFDYKVNGIFLGESFAEIKAKLGNPLNWGLPNPFTSYAFYKINNKFLTIALWRATPDKEYADFKMGTAYAIAYCEEYSAIACEPIIAATIEEIRAQKNLTYLERKPKDYEIDFKADFFNEEYMISPPYPFLGGGYMVNVLFQESGTLVDFWLYDLMWSYLVIRMIGLRNINEIEK
ncbi:toll/interleukin-1 receptor domain-containing protein [Flavobacterium yafengii]|uniref:toll/interleukin-1 receptor domain-containing protein n=1 Tax=Flavobacterium yafengii TaxID=3041253 RepID=UPI0024A9EADB|nr:toll/interleukin-1 receptor domain-containing protein [Flavobacterium yafengii]MDI5887594.1 toll/interleukin-1 receptor domain-containing protein [Flavobacterium yafengii]